MDETIGGVPPQDQVRVILHSTQLEYPITFPFMTPERLTTERILAEFQRVIQSNQEFRLNDTVDVNVIHVSMPSGGKGSKRSEINLEKHLEKKRSIVRIQNDDDLCMARALVVAKAKLDNNPQYKSVVDHRRPMQTRLAQELHQNAGVPLGPCGIEEAKQFQAYLADYQISIVSIEYSSKIIYAGPEKDKKIYLYLHNNHYDVITKMPGFFARVYYCHTCNKAYEHQEEHRCLSACKCCWFPSECPEVSWRTCQDCQDCHRLFKSQQCYEQHKQSRGDARSVCQSLVKCTKCQKVVRRCKQLPEKHRCGLTKCWICGKFVQLEGHRCFIQPETKKKKNESWSGRRRSTRKRVRRVSFLRYRMSTRRTRTRRRAGWRIVARIVILWFRVSTRKREARTEFVYCSKRGWWWMDFPRRQYSERILWMVVHDGTCQL